ncbi:MAG: Biosynthetic peptidoglycan transglycosylase [Sodalis sp.]|nr:MAG: Biosynthetic peptidoglycan transglycosylase [Sodalis sp.]
MRTKQCILTVYLNIVEFGEGIFGVEATPLAAALPNPLSLRTDAPSVYIHQRQRLDPVPDVANGR